MSDPTVVDEVKVAEVAESPKSLPSFDLNDLKAVLVFLENLQAKAAFTLSDLKQCVEAFGAVQQQVTDALEKGITTELKNAHVIALLNALELGLRRGKVSMVESVNVVPVYARLESVLLAHAAALKKQ